MLPKHEKFRYKKNMPQRNDVFDRFKSFVLNVLTAADVEDFPLLHLLYSHKELLNSRLFEMLVKSIIGVLEKLVEQLLGGLSTQENVAMANSRALAISLTVKQPNSIISILDEVTRYVAGLVVFFTVYDKKEALSSYRVDSLAMQFDATPNVSEGAEVKFCSPIISFCRELAKLNHDQLITRLPITEISVHIPLTLKQTLRKNSNAFAAWSKFLKNTEPKEIAYPISAYMCDMGLEPKKLTLCDDDTLATVILDPAHQCILLHGFVFYEPIWVPSSGVIVFSSFLQNGFKQKAACFYNACDSKWYLDILQNTEPLKNTSPDSSVEWESISNSRLHEANPTTTTNNPTSSNIQLPSIH